MLNIYLTNLGKYNEGFLIGEWISLPISSDDLEEVKKRIGINEQYEEWFITDYECDFGYDVGEYENLESLNDIAEIMEDFDSDELDIIKAFLDYGYTFEEAARKVSSHDYMYFSDCNDMTDVAYAYIDETGLLDGKDDLITRYFDYEAFGRDMGIEGHFVFLDNGDCVELL